MRLTVAAVGRLRQGPEAAMVADYLDRFARTGRGIGLPPVSVAEVEAKAGGPAAEADLLAKAVPAASLIVALDERGAMLTSPEFAARLGAWRDAGRDAAFVIGGADGIAPALLDRAGFSISFGRMVWPHLLVRVMLAEQLYRAATILAGGPYHRA